MLKSLISGLLLIPLITLSCGQSFFAPDNSIEHPISPAARLIRAGCLALEPEALQQPSSPSVDLDSSSEVTPQRSPERRYILRPHAPNKSSSHARTLFE